MMYRKACLRTWQRQWKAQRSRLHPVSESKCLEGRLGLGIIPLCFVLGEDLSLGMITENLDINKASQIEFLGPEHRHICGA